jgi:5-(carboxyamino)imidazole ribonucleotide mutase
MTQALIGVVMGSSSDWDTMQHAVQILQQFDIPFEARVVSAHRMPDDMFAYAEGAAGRGLKAIIAGAGGAAHLPGMIAAKTVVPVLGVPVQTKALSGVDSLHSIVQMPKGVPVATFAIGVAGPPMPRCLPWPCWPTKMRPCGPGSSLSAPRRPKRRAP